MARRFNEKDHPRHPRGSGDGGQFREKGSVPTPRKPKAGDSEFTKRQKKRTAAKKAQPAKTTPPKKAPAKKATPPKKAVPTKAPAKKATPAKKAGAFPELTDAQYAKMVAAEKKRSDRDLARQRKEGGVTQDIIDMSIAELGAEAVALGYGPGRIGARPGRAGAPPHASRPELERFVARKRRERASSAADREFNMLDSQVSRVAGAFHEQWRTTQPEEGSGRKPKFKTTTDSAWIKAHGGSDQVDIANSTYNDLPSDWQLENRRAAEVVVGIMHQRGSDLDLNDERTRQVVGDIIHRAWLERNAYAQGGELDVPFSVLPAGEQDKDLDQMAVAQRLLQPDWAEKISQGIPERQPPESSFRMLEQSADLSDLPEEQRPAYQAVLRAAATHGVHTTGDKDRDRMIRNLVAEGFLESDGKGGFGVTEKGFKATGERKAFGQHAWAERIDADIQAKRIEMDPSTYGDEDDENFRDSISWGSRVEELLADEGLHGEIDPNDRADHPDPDEYAQWLIDNGMTQSLSDLFPDEDFAAGPTPEDLAGQARQTERRNYFNALIEEARSFAEADEEEGDESPELRGQIAILERAMRTGTKEEMDAAASHLRRMLTISYADEDEMPDIPPSVQYRPSI